MATGANSTPLGRLHPVLAGKGSGAGPLGNAPNSDLRSHIEAAKRAAEIAASSMSSFPAYLCVSVFNCVFIISADPVYVFRLSSRADARLLRVGPSLGLPSKLILFTFRLLR